MAKRNTDTELWNEDWFIEMSGRNQLFYFYIKDKCDHAGFWRPNFKHFEKDTGFRVNVKEFLSVVNSEYSTGEKSFKERVRVLDNGRWWLVGYIGFHFPILNLNNRFHRSVYDTFTKNVSCEDTTIYDFEVKDTSKTPQEEVKKKERRRKKEEGEDNKEEVKHKYGEYKHVLLSDSQYGKLVIDFGKAKLDQMIRNLDEYLQNKNVTYKDHNLTMRTWERKNNKSVSNNGKFVAEFQREAEESGKYDNIGHTIKV